MRARIALLFLVLTSLACMQSVATPATVFPTTTPGASPMPKSTLTKAPESTPVTVYTALPQITILGTVYVRNSPGGQVVGHIETGEIISAVCSGDWCKIEDGFIWRGCTSDNPAGLGCRER